IDNSFHLPFSTPALFIFETAGANEKRFCSCLTFRLILCEMIEYKLLHKRYKLLKLLKLHFHHFIAVHLNYTDGSLFIIHFAVLEYIFRQKQKNDGTCKHRHKINTVNR